MPLSNHSCFKSLGAITVKWNTTQTIPNNISRPNGTAYSITTGILIDATPKNTRKSVAQLPIREMMRLSTYLSAFIPFNTKWNTIATRKPTEKLGTPSPVAPWITFVKRYPIPVGIRIRRRCHASGSIAIGETVSSPNTGRFPSSMSPVRISLGSWLKSFTNLV